MATKARMDQQFSCRYRKRIENDQLEYITVMQYILTLHNSCVHVMHIYFNMHTWYLYIHIYIRQVYYRYTCANHSTHAKFSKMVTENKSQFNLYMKHNKQNYCKVSCFRNTSTSKLAKKVLIGKVHRSGLDQILQYI